jgi:hypothetical protein
MRKGGMHTVFLWGSYKERDHYEDLGICERIILKWILDRMRWY